MIKPKGSTLAEFQPLRTAELMLLACCRRGEPAEISGVCPDRPNGSNTVRAEFVRFLALGGGDDAPVHAHGVDLYGAWVEGELQLRSAVVPSDLFLIACHFTHAPNFRNAKIEGTLALNQSWVPGLEGDGLSCEGGLFLRANFTATGEVRLLDAQIGGTLDCGNATFHGEVVQEKSNSFRRALFGDRIVVKGGVFLRNGFTATGEVRLLGAQIGGTLDCGGATFHGEVAQEKGKAIRRALSADGIVVKGSIFLRDGFTATGEVRLLGAQIGGNLECDNATFDGKTRQDEDRTEYGKALSADGIVVKGGVFLRDGFSATGEVCLLSAQIDGTLNCGNAKFDGKARQDEGKTEYGNALFGDRIVTKGSVFLRNGFTAKGEVRLLDAQIGGTLECDNATFDGKSRQDEGRTEYGNALFGDRIVTKSSIFLRNGFAAMGEVRLLGAQIGGNLECDNATFDGRAMQDEDRTEYGKALSADGIVVKGGVFLRNKFTAAGAVRLLGAQIGGSLDCIGASFDGKTNERKDGKKALFAQGMNVDGAFFFRKVESPVDDISLAAAHVRVLADDAQSWGKGLVLDGFTYGSIAGEAPTNATTRLAWLDKQSPKDDVGLDGKGGAFKPQPWRQLIKVLREMGHAEEARQVAIAFEDRLREAKLIGRTPNEWWGPWRWIYRASSNLVHWALGKFTGYGHRPQFLFFWMLGVWLGCGLFYTYSAQNAAFAPTSPPVVQQTYGCKSSAPSLDMLPNAGPATRPNWYLCDSLPESYPRLNPWVYSLDVLLPPVNLQQSNNWGPISSPPASGWLDDPLRHLTRSVVWLEHLFGWLSTGLLLAMVSGVMKRRED